MAWVILVFSATDASCLAVLLCSPPLQTDTVATPGTLEVTGTVKVNGVDLATKLSELGTTLDTLHSNMAKSFGAGFAPLSKFRMHTGMIFAKGIKDYFDMSREATPPSAHVCDVSALALLFALSLAPNPRAVCAARDL